MTSPFFSIIVLYWNAAAYLPRCLESLATQTEKDFEVILLDNASPQPLDEDLVRQYPNVKVIASAKNLGFAAGNNLAARSANGKYLVLLNSDAYPEPNWLAVLRAAAEGHPGFCFASQLIRADDPSMLDGEWNDYHFSGLAWRHGHGLPAATASPSRKLVASACAAAAAYPRAAFQTVGGFDEAYFAYMEDVDLDLRLRAAGFPCLYLPEARVLHVGSGSTDARSDFVTFHGHRNLVWTFIKNMTGIWFWLLLPWHILVNFLYLAASCFLPQGAAIRKGKLAALRQLPRVWKQRQNVQAQRKASTWSILRSFNWNPIAPLIKLTFK